MFNSIVYRLLKENVKNGFMYFKNLYNLKGDNIKDKKFVSNFYSNHNDKVLFIATHKIDFDNAIINFKKEITTLKNIDKQIETNLIKKRLIPILEKALNEQNTKNKFIEELYKYIIYKYKNKNLLKALNLSKDYIKILSEINN